MNDAEFLDHVESKITRAQFVPLTREEYHRLLLMAHVFSRLDVTDVANNPRVSSGYVLALLTKVRIQRIGRVKQRLTA